MALYKKRFILLTKDGVKLPSNLQGLYEVRYSSDGLDGDATIRLMKAINEKQKQLLKHTAKGGQGSGKMGKGVLVFKLTSMPLR